MRTAWFFITVDTVVILNEKEAQVTGEVKQDFLSPPITIKTVRQPPAC